MHIPGRAHRTDHVVATLDDHRRPVAHRGDVGEQLVVAFEETLVREIVTLDAREGFCKLAVAETIDHVEVRKQFAGRAFPDAPRPEEQTSELQSLISHPIAVYSLTQK